MKNYATIIVLIITSIFFVDRAQCQNSKDNKAISLGLVQSKNNLNLVQVFPFLTPDNDFEIKGAANQLGISFIKTSRGGYRSTTYASSIYSDNYSRFVQGLGGLLETEFRLLFLDLHIRLERGYLFQKKGMKNLKYGVGFSIDPRYVYRSSKSFELTSFPMNLHSIELAANVIPLIEYKLAKRLFLHIKVPLEVFSCGILRGTSKSPELRLEEQLLRHSYNNIGTLQPTINAGLALKL